jgi:hypothetical protein
MVDADGIKLELPVGEVPVLGNDRDLAVSEEDFFQGWN